MNDRVRHIRKPKMAGTIVEINKRNSGALVDLSDDHGVKFRWISFTNLEVINEDEG